MDTSAQYKPQQLVEVDGNFIGAEPMKNKSEGAMIKAYTTLWKILTASGTVKPKTHILDNEASKEFKRELQNNCMIQLVPPDSTDETWQNERYKPLKTTSNQSAGIDDTFPMRL